MIETAEQLNSVRNYLTKHFVQIADIDLASYNEGKVGNPSEPHFQTCLKVRLMVVDMKLQPLINHQKKMILILSNT